MGLDAAYATVTDLKGYADNFTDTTDDAELGDILLQASRAVDQYCGRQFNKATSATARVYYPASYCHVEPDEFWTTTGLIVATSQGDDGTYGTTLDTTQYQLLPLNGVVDGESGWPYSRIQAQNTWFPVNTVRPSVQVTAQWGWAAVPTGIKIATIYLALETYKLKGAPFGVAGFGDFGPIRVRENPRVMAMLNPYRRYPVLVA